MCRDGDTTCEAEKISQEPNKVFEWVVVRDHIPPNPPSQYESHGVINFDASTFDNIDVKSDSYSYPFAKLLEDLWPGVWRDQLKKMNTAVRDDNRSRCSNARVKECSEDEWWTIWGVIIFAAKVGKGGIDHLYNKTQQLLEQLPNIDLSEVMTKTRAQQLIKFIPSAFHGDDNSDPWNPVMALLNGFNDNRSKKVAASFCKILDEKMSAFRPRTTKTGELPFLSFIMRKPTPFGTEFKTVACCETGECWYA